MSKNKLDKTIVINGQSYHINKVIDATAKSLHHIIGRCNRQEYNTNEDVNKIIINDRQHVALNKFFNQNQSPHEQLKQCMEIWEPALSEAVKAELYAILSLPRELFYKEELVKKKYKGKSLFSDDSIYKEKI